MNQHRRRIHRVEQISARERLGQMHLLPRTLKLVWAAAPVWTAISLVLMVIQGLLPLASVYLTRQVVNALVVIVGQPGDPNVLLPALTTVVLMGLVTLLSGVLGHVSNYVQAAQGEQVRDQMYQQIHSQAMALDMGFFESPFYYDQLQRASIDAIERPLGLVQSLSRLLQNMLTLVAMAGVLLSFAWWLPLALLAAGLPALAVAIQGVVLFHRWRRKHTIDERRLIYYNRTLILDEAAPELRIFGLGPRFADVYNILRRSLRGERLALMRTQMFGQIGALLVALLSMAATMAWIIWQALQGRFSLGDIAMLFQSMSIGQGLIQSLLGGISEIYRNLLFLDDLFAFLELEPVLRDPVTPQPMPDGLREGIELRAIRFSYPYSERTALDGFNLHIPAGQVVAIVGENGAGKSTLIKLLCRFYDPELGTISWDGVDLRAVRQQELRQRISVLFQQPIAYHETVADNIAFGDYASRPDQALIEQAAQAAGATEVIAKLPQGYATILGKWFGYTQLSTGEWQRIALARAFVRQADLVILDEPTSAMDSWAENDWMHRFRNLVNGRTALIITHRFTTAMQADVIHVMQSGRIVESGSHAELIARNGPYAQSWRQQIHEAEQQAAM